jgi:hypothetical protein
MVANLYIRDYILGFDSSVWSTWNLFFDSRGLGIHGNRFWRDLLDLETK